MRLRRSHHIGLGLVAVTFALAFIAMGFVSAHAQCVPLDLNCMNLP